MSHTRVNMLILVLVLLTLLGPAAIQTSPTECRFNPLCLCSNYTVQYYDVTCISVPLDELPSAQIGEQFPLLYRLRVVGSRDLTSLGPNSFTGLSTLGSLIVSKSRLSWLEKETFSNNSIISTLSSVELSHGHLTEFPSQALAPLIRLQWLSLKNNKIEAVRIKDFAHGQLNGLRNLILAENQITIVEEGTFSSLTQLERLDLDSNLIERIEGIPFPPFLRSLSLSNCLLRKVPFASLVNLPHLSTLQLRGNLIAHVSPFKLSNRRLELVDLSHNLITKLPLELFNLFPRTELFPVVESDKNATPIFHIERLYLDFNFIQALPADLFRSVEISQLTLSSNRIRSDLIDSDAFSGPLEKTLKVLDLNYNLLDRYPDALKRLSGLRQLTLKNNRLRSIDLNSFESAAQTLEVLDLSQNLLSKVPNSSLAVLRTLFKINLHDNLITRVSAEDFAGPWCEQVRSITLSKNSLQSIHPESFDACSKLTELRIGGNRLLEIQDFPSQALLSSQLQLLEMSSLASVVNMFEKNTGSHSSAKFLDSSSRVKWLQFDNNGLVNFPDALHDLFPSLMYLDLQNNRIMNFLSSDITGFANLTNVILSQNDIHLLPVEAFRRLDKLESISLYANRIELIRTQTFVDLPKLQSLILSRNRIFVVERGAFRNLSGDTKSLTLMLDDNKISSVCPEDFEDIASTDNNQFSLYLNVSGNNVEDFALCNKKHVQLPVKMMDFSKNRLRNLDSQFFSSFLSKAESFIANENQLSNISLGALLQAKNLQTLSLNSNKLTTISAEYSLKSSPETLSLQTLSLRENIISSLDTSLRIFFEKSTNLKFLDLSKNSLRDIPENFFSKTSLLQLNLAENLLDFADEQTSHPNSSDCFGVSKTLKFLDIRQNRLRTFPTRILSCSRLYELLLSDNQIVSLSQVPSIARTLPQLRTLDLERNPLSDQFLKVDFLSGHASLSSLKLNQIGGVEQLEELAVPFLRRLELARNNLSSIQSRVLAKSRNIRYLGLAENSLTDVPKHVWKYVTRLQHLDLRDNPIEILDSSSFAGLKYLRHLDIRGLPLQFVDSRILLYQSQLSSLSISTHPSIRGFRLKDILAKSDALKTVEIEVAESILTHQIQWAFGGKLRELRITGNSLTHILPDAFQGLNNANDLTLRITNTSIERLPDGLLRYLADIRYITIDLRQNLLRTVAPTVFFDRFLKTDAVKTWQSRQMLGGIILSDNPLNCDCNLLWIAQWMQELFSEMKSINIDAAIHVKASLAASTCQMNSGLRNSTEKPEIRPISHLTELDVIHCQAAASFRSSSNSVTSGASTFNFRTNFLKNCVAFILMLLMLVRI